MTVPVSADRLSMIQRLVSTGAFQTEEAVVNAAVDLLISQRREERLRAEIQAGLDDLDAGRVISLHSEEEIDRFFDKLMDDADARRDAKARDAS
jgi:Arc/MetJ-type ribon-helix-helix transcriptional regulator